MEEVVYSRCELLEKTGISEEKLVAFEEAGLFQPAGSTSGDTPIYDQASVEEIPKIAALADVGYSFAEIRRILKKVGLPRAGQRASRRKIPYLTVGELAQRAEISPRAIKYWEEKGIFEAQTRTDGGFRLYPEIYVLFCHLVKDLQNFGVRLEEIKEVADMFREFHAISQHIEACDPEAAAGRLETMQQKMVQLRTRMEELKAGIKRWERTMAEKSKEIEHLRGQLRRRMRAKAEASAGGGQAAEPAPGHAGS